jgi:hypothetical protein
VATLHSQLALERATDDIRWQVLEMPSVEQTTLNAGRRRPSCCSSRCCSRTWQRPTSRLAPTLQEQQACRLFQAHAACDIVVVSVPSSWNKGMAGCSELTCRLWRAAGTLGSKGAGKGRQAQCPQSQDPSLGAGRP